MNLAEFSISKSVITWTIMFLLLVVGLMSFGGLPRLEDPEFTIKEALILTPYPGASAAEVEEEVKNQFVEKFRYSRYRFYYFLTWKNGWCLC